MTRPTQTLEVDAVILDLDDTLIVEHEYVRSGYRSVARMLAGEIGLDEATIAQRLDEIYHSPDRGLAYDALLGPIGREDLVPATIAHYRSHEPEISLSPDGAALLDILTASYPIAVVTDGPEVMQDAKVRAVGLRERGIPVVLTDTLGGRETWKPSPAGLVVAASQLGVEPHRCVYVGDNPHKDFLAARRAGMHSIRYRTAGQLHATCEPEPDEGPDLEVTELRDVLAALRPRA